MIWLKDGVENVGVGVLYEGVRGGKGKGMGLEYVEGVGVKEWGEEMGKEMWGGEKEGVGIGGGLIRGGEIMVGEEGRGGVERKSWVEVMEIVKELDERGMRMVVVREERGVGNEREKIMEIKEGVIGRIEEKVNEEGWGLGKEGLMK